MWKACCDESLKKLVSSKGMGIVSFLMVKRLWEKTIHKALEACPQTDEDIGLLWLNAGLLRFFYKTFSLRCTESLCGKDLLCAFAFELLAFNIEMEVRQQRQFVNVFLREWYRALNSSYWAKWLLKSKANVHPADILNELSFSTQADEELISDRFSIQKNYFLTYTEDMGTDIINVYLPGEDQITDVEDLSRCISIPVISHMQVGIGFFRLGHEYSCGSQSSPRWLKVATLCRKTLVESFGHDNMDFTHKTPIWVH